MNTQYRIEIEHDGEEWVVRFPQLRGCNVGRGLSIEGAISAAEIAQEEYLERFEKARAWPVLL